MSQLVPVPRLHPIYRIGQGTQSYGSEHWRYVPFCYRLMASGLLSELRDPPNDLHLTPDSTSIAILDDDCLLNIFRLYCPDFLYGIESDAGRVVEGWKGHRDRVRWWYKLVHVCRRWRHLVFGSASYLGLCLLCTHGTPVADMLAHSPPLPLVIDHDFCGSTAGDAKQLMILIDPQHRDRMRGIRLSNALPEKLIVAVDDEFPMLEYLSIVPRSGLNFTRNTGCLVLPRTFQAPRLRHLILSNFARPIGSPPHLGATNLVTLSLLNIPFGIHFGLDTLLEWVSLLPRLETLWIEFCSRSPFLPLSTEVEWPLAHIQNMPYVTLPNLCNLNFRGVIVCLEALLSRITAPRLDVLHVIFKFIAPQPTFSIPYLLQFMSTSENLKLRRAELVFGGQRVGITAYPDETAALSPSFILDFPSGRLGLKVSSAAKILYVLSPVFTSVMDLTLNLQTCRSDSWIEWQIENEVELTQWRTILRSFNNANTLRIRSGLVGVLSRSLQLNDGESPTDLLPCLKELIYSPTSRTGDAFRGFIDARQNAGHPVTLVRD